MTESLDELSTKLNTQTGKVSWPDIQRHFARGVVLVVGCQADLLNIAADIIRDNHAAVEDFLANEDLKKASIEDARSWQENDPLFWSVVVAPWLLIQEIKEKNL